MQGKSIIKVLIEIHIDHLQMGVGGDNTWGYHTHDKYKLLDNNYSYSFVLCPVVAKNIDELNEAYYRIKQK